MLADRDAWANLGVKDLARDVAAVAEALREKGVGFEHYDSEGMTRDGDVHFGNGMITWFKDPSGNILNLVSA